MRIPIVKYHYLIILLLMLVLQAECQHEMEKRQKIDVQHYDYSISLSDTSDIIFCSATIDMIFREPVEFFSLDLTTKDESGKGMTVKRVTVDGKASGFRQQNDSLYVFREFTKAGVAATVMVEYSGIPADGLIISKNKFGNRTFFGDNWPDRAHNWLACIDHPSDKATVDFIVKAPDHYEVIANGNLMQEADAGNHYKLSHWRSEEQLPTKVMVIGVAEFGIDTVKNDLGIPVSTWSYLQDTAEWFPSFRSAAEPISFYENIVGPYPFSKLADVQSTTIYGGMENAGNIFYREDLMNSKRNQYKINPEGTIAHEIAHQWFGNSVTEGNWYDVWISEGFATYLTDLFYEHKYGREALKTRMAEERNMVIRYYKRNPAPVIDTTVTDYSDLLTINVYEKAAWFLHMMRREMGDEVFMKCIGTFYEKYKYSNAVTEDFQDIAESLSGKDLGRFFEQWLRKPGYPVLNINWYQKKDKIFVKIEQQQKNPVFNFSLDLGIINADSTMKTVTIQMERAVDNFSFPADGKVANLVPDPEVWLLFEGTVSMKKF